MTALVEFLFPTPATRSTKAIVKWWESRRLHYNLIVGGSGVFSLAMVRLVTWLPPGHSEMVPWQLVIVFGVLANVCYTLGPMAETAIDKLWGRAVLPVGPGLLRMGLTFSVGLTLLPTLLAGLDWGFRVLRAVFG